VTYLVRFHDPGREAQRRKTARDLREQLAARVPGARVEELGAGRLAVETPGPADEVLASLHGVTSFSPCRAVALDALPEALVALAETALVGVRRFAVKVKRVGAHAFGSVEKAAALADLLRARLPHLAVDLSAPEVTLGVEIRDARAFLFERVVPGFDHAGAAPPAAEGPPRFLVDQMLGRLAAWLRMLGFDTAYVVDAADSFLVRKANAEQRILVTRDRPLARVRAARIFAVTRATLPEQLREVVEGLRLPVRRADLFRRCARCNAPVERVDKEAVRARVPPEAYARHAQFTWCRTCDKVYWPGGHYERVLAALDGLLE
jgi:uncharacterized protein with PIN domain